MSATMHRESVHGIEIGAGMGLAVLVFAISMAFVGMNGYHMSNYLVSKLTTAETAFYVIWWWKAVGFGVAALEIPLGMSFITNYRLHGFWHIGVLSQLVLALIVAALAAGAGIGSQLADAETRTNQISSHNTQLGGYQNRAEAAKFDRDSRLLATQHIKDPVNQEIAQLKIKQRYQQIMARLAETTAGKQAKKPLKIMNDGDSQFIIFALLSVAASIGAFYLSCFHAVYIKQLVGLIAFSLKSKANHEWESHAADFKTKQHEISPLNGQNHGLLTKERVPSRTTLSSPESLQSKFKSSQKEELRSKENVYVKCPACDAVFSVEKALMVPSPKNKQGQLRCGECAGIFHGVINIVDSDSVNKKRAERLAKIQPKELRPRRGGLLNNDPKAEQTGDKNSIDTEIPEKFPANSSQIPVNKQQDSVTKNSSGIPQEFAKNLAGISNSQEFPRNSADPDSVDLSHIASSDPAEKKLADLEETIDRLSLDPRSDGLKFSPTRMKTELSLGYDRIQEVFEKKKTEGKISQTKPYKIIYRATI